MAQSTFDPNFLQTIAILHHYRFDLTGAMATDLINQWEQKYSALWIRLAVIEALYQGRYKSFSVEQILRHWLRQGKPTVHFNHDFERLVCHNLPSMTESSQTSFAGQNSSAMMIDTHSQIVSPSFNLSPQLEISQEKTTLLPIPSPLHSKSITQFTPILDHSQSYAKLREAAYQASEEE